VGRLSISGDRAKITAADRNTPDDEVSDLFIAFDDGRQVVFQRQKHLRDSDQPIVISVSESFSVNR